jgi:mannose-6-phosphate isomerase
MTIQPLTPRFLEKIWGSRHLSPWFPDSDSKTGEVWLEGPAREALPLLIKFLFTTDRLSVQVHPNDDYARRHHQSNGKTEMWHILRADPGAQVALGLKRPMTAAELRASSESGAIEEQLNWVDVCAGDTYFVPAGTIHAIGAGIALCEIQQQSDVTYRLYDYGRPRELHLDRGVEVSHLGQHMPADQFPADSACLALCKYFCTFRLVIDGQGALDAKEMQVGWLICIEGEGIIEGVRYRAGQAWQLDAVDRPLAIQSQGRSVFLKTFVPEIL